MIHWDLVSKREVSSRHTVWQRWNQLILSTLMPNNIRGKFTYTQWLKFWPRGSAVFWQHFVSYAIILQPRLPADLCLFISTRSCTPRCITPATFLKIKAWQNQKMTETHLRSPNCAWGGMEMGNQADSLPWATLSFTLTSKPTYYVPHQRNTQGKTFAPWDKGCKGHHYDKHKQQCYQAWWPTP